MRCSFCWLHSHFEQALGERVKDVAILDGSRPFLTKDCQDLRAALGRLDDFIGEEFEIPPYTIDKCQTSYET